MTYSRSYPLNDWLTERRDAIEVLSRAHQYIGRVAGPGRPREVGRRVAHAYILQMVADFQAFARDLHDLAASSIVGLSGVAPQFRVLLVGAATEGRSVDRGNADLRALQVDFRRLGIAGLNGQLQHRDGTWNGDKANYEGLIELRNAVAHGNQRQLDSLRRRGVLDTRTWAHDRRPSLNRIARALDAVVWDHLEGVYRQDPW